MKVKPSKNMLYTVKANVFPVKLGSKFGRTVHTTVLANNKEDAYKEAEKSFKHYCTNLEKNHNTSNYIDFDYTDLTIE